MGSRAPWSLFQLRSNFTFRRKISRRAAVFHSHKVGISPAERAAHTKPPLTHSSLCHRSHTRVPSLSLMGTNTGVSFLVSVPELGECTDRYI